MIESMICSLGAIIIKILPQSLVFFWLILDRYSCLMLIALNKKQVKITTYASLTKGSNYSKFKTGPR